MIALSLGEYEIRPYGFALSPSLRSEIFHSSIGPRRSAKAVPPQPYTGTVANCAHCDD